MFPAARHSGSLSFGRFLLALLTGNQEGSMGYIVYRERPRTLFIYTFLSWENKLAYVDRRFDLVGVSSEFPEQDFNYLPPQQTRRAASNLEFYLVEVSSR